MSKHTPGPWKAVDVYPDEYHIAGPDGIRLASAWFIFDPDETAANTYLIAAAPRMYAALRRLIDLYPTATGADWDDARAAVAQAEGRES